MKRFDEIGASPMPWKSVEDGMGYRDIRCNIHVSEDSEGEDIIAELVDARDARVMEAAPELYEELREATETMCSKCCHYDVEERKCYDGIECKPCGCKPKKWRMLLERVSGVKKSTCENQQDVI